MTDQLVEAGSEAADEPLDTEWRRWAAVSLLNGSPLVDVLESLREQGLPEEASIRYCASLFDSDAFAAGRWPAQQLGKLNSVLVMLEKMRALAPRPMVERRSGVGREEFLANYYSQNKPVLLTDVCDRWPACKRWNGTYLVDKLGDVDIEVMAGRDGDSDYELNADRHKAKMSFAQYDEWVRNTKDSNDRYLVANNGLLSTEAGAVLWDDFDLDPRYLARDPQRQSAFLWYGPGGTVTPLHHDSSNIMFNQVMGRKRFIMIPTLEIHRVYNNVSVYSDVDPLNPDLEQFPAFEGIEHVELEVGPGDSLFIPVGWWHHVTSLDTSVSISFTNFAFPNGFDWVDPERVL
jgi:ribosomal protein L16 Arg81 hydroxylase